METAAVQLNAARRFQRPVLSKGDSASGEQRRCTDDDQDATADDAANTSQYSGSVNQPLQNKKRNPKSQQSRQVASIELEQAMANGRESADSRRYLDEEEVTPMERREGEEEMELVLSGRAPDHAAINIDVVTHPADLQFTPVVMKTVSYVVAGVVVNSRGQILLMQEAKPQYRGKWYLPAGRMTSNETIAESAKRQIFEETGLDCEPISVVCVERAPGMWFRFTFYCQQRGGRLKGKAFADEESLQARWFHEHEISENSVYFPLRYPDILPLVERGKQYHEYYQKLHPGALVTAHSSNPSKLGATKRLHPVLLPATVPHKYMLLRPFIVQQTLSRHMYVLFARRSYLHLPIGTVISRGGDPQYTLREILKDAFGHRVQEFTIHGVVNIEHGGRPASGADGVLLSVLVGIPDSRSVYPTGVDEPDKYMWLPIDSTQLHRDILDRCGQLRTVPLCRL